jgi:hypothetical protein
MAMPPVSSHAVPMTREQGARQRQRGDNGPQRPVKDAGQPAERAGLGYRRSHRISAGTCVVGESSFDSVEQLWFDDVAAVREALYSPHYTSGRGRRSESSPIHGTSSR